MRNTGQYQQPPCTKNFRTARPRQEDIGIRLQVSEMRVALRLVSLMPFRVYLKLIEVAIDCTEFCTFTLERVKDCAVEYLRQEEDIGGEPGGCCGPNGAGLFEDRGTQGKLPTFLPNEGMI
jgi:hypothetical protein